MMMMMIIMFLFYNFMFYHVFKVYVNYFVSDVNVKSKLSFCLRFHLSL